MPTSTEPTSQFGRYGANGQNRNKNVSYLDLTVREGSRRALAGCENQKYTFVSDSTL